MLKSFIGTKLSIGFFSLLLALPTVSAAQGLYENHNLADACAKITIDFIKGIAAAYGEFDGGYYLANGKFTYGANGLVEFAGDLNNSQSLGRLKIAVKLDPQCRVSWSEVSSKK